MQIDDMHFMRKALDQAKIAFDKNEVPVGAVVVDNSGIILAQAHNLVESEHTQTAHAEMQALREAAQKIEDWRLEDCSVYVTLEPCAMCMALIMLSRIKRLVFGALSPEFGYHLDSCLALNLYKRKLEITSGIYSEEAAQLLEDFFRKRRSRGHEGKSRGNT